jgi:YVTN family beta-propeller protein
MRRAPWSAGALLLSLLAGCAALAPSPRPASHPVVLATMQVGNAPTLLAVAPDGRHVYAASGSSLSVVDTATNRIVTTIGINPHTTGVAVSPDGSRVYVANLFSIMLTVLDTATNTLAQPITMFLQRQRGGFGSMAVAPDGRTIYIANRDNRALGIIPVDGGGSLVRPSVAPIAVAITRDGRTVYTAGCRPICTPGFVNSLDTATRRFGDALAVEGNPFRIVLSPDDRFAYVANRTGPSVSAVDLAAWRVERTYRVPVQPTGLAISPAGDTLYVASQTEGMLTVLDAATGATRGQLAVPRARDVAVSPDGRIVYVSTHHDFLVVDAQALVETP